VEPGPDQSRSYAQWPGQRPGADDDAGDDAGKVVATYGAAIVAQQNGDHVSARPFFDSACGAVERLGVPQFSRLEAEPVKQAPLTRPAAS